MSGRLKAATLLLLGTLLTSCASQRTPPASQVNPLAAREMIEQAVPARVADRAGWTSDIYTAFKTQSIEPTRANVCAVVAVIEQESGFSVNTVIPGLPAIAWQEIHKRADHAGVPWIVVTGALGLSSPNGRTYSQRIDGARTEKDLSDIYEDFIGSVPMGRTLFEDRNPIRTRGPMQVNVAFVKQSAATGSYPYPVKQNLGDELFTRRGSVYFGVAHLLGYQAPYDDSYLYRFADYNAGQYASRNAAFQAALGRVSGTHLTPDGALLPHDEAKQLGETELAARDISERLKVSEDAIHAALTKGKSAEFQQTALYKRVFELADHAAGKPVPRALVPRIKLQGPKISRQLTTDWYAHRVEGRFEHCLNQAVQ